MWLELATFFHMRRSRSTDLREANRVERVLATGRLILAVGAFIAAYPDLSELLRHPSLTRAVLLGYIIYALAILGAARFRTLAGIRAGIHLLDLAWVALLSGIAGVPGSPFFVFFTFLLVAAGWRWGFVETMATGLAIGMIFAAQTRLPGVSVYLMLATVLLAIVSETEKQLRDEKGLIASALSKARADTGVTQSVQEILDEIRLFYEASRIVFVVEELATGRLFTAERANKSNSDRLTFAEQNTEQRPVHLFPSGADTWRCGRNRRRSRIETRGIDAFGNIVRSPIASPPDTFWDFFPCRSFLATVVSFGDELAGRLYILDSRRIPGRFQDLSFLQRMIRPVNSALYNVYLWRRLRAKAGEIERARVARELHDGLIQSLIGLEMQMDVLKHQSSGRTASRDIARIQESLRTEIQNVRTLMNEMRPLSICPDDMVPFMGEMVEKFATGTSIAATFVADASVVDLPPQVCRELVQILQEALTNVRKHSDAHHVVVRFKSSEQSWQLSIEDDGKGFDFEGNLSQDQLDEQHTGPVVIKERVRLIQGSLEIESHPGRGSLLKINLLKHIYA